MSVTYLLPLFRILPSCQSSTPSVPEYNNLEWDKTHPGMFRYIVLGWPNHPLQFHCTCPRRQGATTISPRQQRFCLCWLRTTHAPSSDPLNTHKKKRKKKNTNRNPCFPISIFEHCYSELDLELLAVMDGEKREKEYDKRRV